MNGVLSKPQVFQPTHRIVPSQPGELHVIPIIAPAFQLQLACLCVHGVFRQVHITCNSCCDSESIEDRAIGEEADEPVSHSDFVEEGLLGLHDVGVRHPEELHEARVESEARVALEHQPPVRPALSEVYGGCVVLKGSQGVAMDEGRKT